MATTKLKWVNTSSTVLPCMRATTDKGTWSVQRQTWGDQDLFELSYAEESGNFYTYLFSAKTEAIAMEIAALCDERITPRR